MSGNGWCRCCHRLGPRRGVRWRDHRQVLTGILFRARTGIPWRDLPERYGPWQTVYKRFALAERWDLDAD
jgi:transposase